MRPTADLIAALELRAGWFRSIGRPGDLEELLREAAQRLRDQEAQIQHLTEELSAR